MVRRIQLAILSDSRLFCEALSSCLASQGGIEVVAAAGTVHDLLDRTTGRAVDVLLVYLSIESTITLEIARDVVRKLPAACAVVLGCEQSKVKSIRWGGVGALAGLQQEASYGELVEAIQGAA